MKMADEFNSRATNHPPEGQGPVFVAMPISEFEREVLDRLGRLETKVDMLVGNGQPGRMARAENRLEVLEKSDIRRSVYDRLLNAVIAVFVSAAIAMHDHLGLK